MIDHLAEFPRCKGSLLVSGRLCHIEICAFDILYVCNYYRSMHGRVRVCQHLQRNVSIVAVAWVGWEIEDKCQTCATHASDNVSDCCHVDFVLAAHSIISACTP